MEKASILPSVLKFLTVVIIGVGIYFLVRWFGGIGGFFGENLDCKKRYEHPSGDEKKSHVKDNVFADMSICYKCPFGHQDRTIHAVTNWNACEGTCTNIRAAHIEKKTLPRNSDLYENDSVDGYPIMYHDTLASLCYLIPKGAKRSVYDLRKESAFWIYTGTGYAYKYLKAPWLESNWSPSEYLGTTD
jgi:hypothetical protein